MGKQILVMLPLEDGKQLIEELDKDEFDFPAAFWLYNEEKDSWKLTIATPLYELIGPLDTYDRIQTALLRLPEDRDLALNDISAVSSSNPMIVALRNHYHVGPHDPIKKLDHTRLDGIYIDQAIIYRLL